jgi:hypothetical protein
MQEIPNIVTIMKTYSIDLKIGVYLGKEACNQVSIGIK